jgi:membrane protein required for colicin V production
MLQAQLNLFDAVVIGVVFLSAALAFFRGFLREVLSLGAWVGAALVTVYYFPEVTEKLQPYFANPVVAAGFATLGTYITTLMVISILNAVILRYVKEGKEVGVLDNMLGLIFGLARGIFTVALGFLIMTMMVPKEQYPLWVQESESREYVEYAARALVRISPQYVKDLTPLAQEADEMKDEDKEKGKEMLQKLKPGESQ